MEEVSRRVLLALAVGAAGPAAAGLVFLVVAPAAVLGTAAETDADLAAQTGSLFVGLVLGGLLAAGLGVLVGLAATVLALRLTRCARPDLASLVCLLLTPAWLGVLSTFPLELPAFLALAGAVPFAVRLGFGEAAEVQPVADQPG